VALMNDPRETSPLPRHRAPPRYVWGLAALAIVVLAIAGWHAAQWLAPYFSRARVESWVLAAGAWGPLILLGVQAAQILVAPIPGGFVPILAGVLYGPLMGPLLTMGGTILGSTAAYWIGRSAGRAVAERWIGKPALDRAHAMLAGKRWVALAVIFLVPFSPADSLCFMAGILRMSWGPFSGAVLAGRLPKDMLIAAGAALGWNHIGLGG
jgi:uncharacterized membrane protein YdjX (TVP38/TMEM64 family)